MRTQQAPRKTFYKRRIMFSDYLSSFDINKFFAITEQADSASVIRVLEKDRANINDLPVLLSREAEKHIEKMSELSSRITRQRFGNIMQLYVPLYLSNKCENTCLYCGFRKGNKIKRATLSVTDVLREADILHGQGFRNILLVAGATHEVREKGYLETIVKKLSEDFTSVSIEIEELNTKEYKDLVNANLDGVTLYQETYDEELYPRLHRSGGKANYKQRLDSMDKIGASGVRKLGIGVLLGLSDFRKEACVLGLHCKYLINKYWRSSVGVSFPRLCESESSYKAMFPVSDTNLSQMIFAFRIVFPDNDLVLSTRESSEIRDYLCERGITYMSAGSRTSPGGYSKNRETGKQFEIADTRSVKEIHSVLENRGRDVVWKDWN